MNCMGMLPNNNSDLFVVEWWSWRNILDDAGEPKEFALITTPIIGWLINGGDDGCCSIPLLANGKAAEDDDDIFILWDSSTKQWQIYQFRFGVGEESPREFIIEEAQEHRRWSDRHSRAALLKRCAEYDMTSVVLMFGNHDPGGLSITDSYQSNLKDVLVASELESMPDIRFVRVGLNVADIDRLGLVWIDNLETSSGGDLGSPEHKQHKSKHVQDYIARFGKRKCEANALLRNPKAAQQILVDAIREFVDDNEVAAYYEQVKLDAEAANQEVSKILDWVQAA